jgi:hypothetical protein
LLVALNLGFALHRETKAFHKITGSGAAVTIRRVSIKGNIQLGDACLQNGDFNGVAMFFLKGF